MSTFTPEVMDVGIKPSKPEWIKRYDERYSRHFYFNTKSKESVWVEPAGYIEPAEGADTEPKRVRSRSPARKRPVGGGSDTTADKKVPAASSNSDRGEFGKMSFLDHRYYSCPPMGGYVSQ